MKDNMQQFRKNFAWNTLGTGLNAFNSLFFMIIVTRINGVNEAGIFTLAFSTACILYSVGVYAGRIYQVTELNEKITDKDFIISKTITSIAMIIFLLVFCVFKGYETEKMIVFLLLTIYKSLDAFFDVFYGILQKNERLDIVGKSLTIKSLVSVAVFLLVDILINNMIVAIALMILTYLLICIFYDLRKTRSYINLEENAKIKNILNIFQKGFFLFIVSFLNIYLINIPKYSIDSYLGDDIQTIFGIIIMPATVISLIAQFLIYPYLNKIVEFYKNKEIDKFKNLRTKIVIILIVLGIFAAIIGYLVGTQILGLIYGLNLSAYKINLAIVIISATLYAIGTVYSSILTTVRETKSQFIIYVVVAVIASIISIIFTKNFEINGAIISYFITMLLFSLLYVVYTNLKLKKIFNEEKERKIS